MKKDDIKKAVDWIASSIKASTENIDFALADQIITGLVDRARREEESDWRMAIVHLDEKTRQGVIETYNNVQKRLKNTGHYE